MSLPVVLKIGAALGVGGLVYWGVSALWGGSATTAPATTAKPKAKPATYGGGAPSGGASAPDPGGDLSGTTEGADAIGGGSANASDKCYDAVGLPVPCWF